MLGIYYSLIQIEKNNYTDLKYGRWADEGWDWWTWRIWIKSNKWYIHISLIDLFKVKEHRVQKKIYYVK
jgi:hypothetical protein